MTTSAIVLMILTMGTVTAFTIYFFVKILRAPLPTDQADDGAKDGTAGH